MEGIQHTLQPSSSMFGTQDINRYGGWGTGWGVNDGVQGPICVPCGDPTKNFLNGFHVLISKEAQFLFHCEN